MLDRLWVWLGIKQTLAVRKYNRVIGIPLYLAAAEFVLVFA